MNPDLVQVQEKLQKKEGLIDYWSNDTALAFIFVTQDTAIIHFDWVPDFNNKVNQALYAVKTNGKCESLFPILFAGIEQQMLNLDKLIIIPDNNLLKLPFESLITDKGTYLIQDLCLSYNYSTSVWYNNSPNLKLYENIKLMGVAPVFEKKHVSTNTTAYWGIGKTPFLPYTKAEINNIGDISKSNHVSPFLLFKQHANEYNVKQNLSNYDIIHFATHGLVNKQNPERSGLFLYNNNLTDSTLNDNYLSLGEIYNSKLKANLVVLSACKSGSGTILESEGIMALPRGFIYAGVPNVIASLWKVHDEKTKELMVSFYTRLFEDKLSYATALRLAKMDCIEKGFLPIDWAGFVLIGN
jgi:CHAT domain-containing protein